MGSATVQCRQSKSAAGRKGGCRIAGPHDANEVRTLAVAATMQAMGDRDDVLRRARAGSTAHPRLPPIPPMRAASFVLAMVGLGASGCPAPSSPAPAPRPNPAPAKATSITLDVPSAQPSASSLPTASTIVDRADAEDGLAKPNRDRTHCATVHIGLDLRALPQPVEPQDVQMHTLGQSDDFKQLAPPGTAVDLFFRQGAAIFVAEIFRSSQSEALATCRSMTQTFLPKVPGHPRSRESGGSLLEACAPCKAARP